MRHCPSSWRQPVGLCPARLADTLAATKHTGPRDSWLAPGVSPDEPKQCLYGVPYYSGLIKTPQLSEPAKNQPLAINQDRKCMRLKSSVKRAARTRKRKEVYRGGGGGGIPKCVKPLIYAKHWQNL